MRHESNKFTNPPHGQPGHVCKKMVDYFTPEELSLLPIKGDNLESVKHDLAEAGYSMLYDRGQLASICVNPDKFKIDYAEKVLVAISGERAGESFDTQELAEEQTRRHMYESLSVN